MRGSVERVSQAELSPELFRRSRKIRIVLVTVVVVALFAAQRLGVFAHFANPAALKQTLVDLGPLGYLAFLLAFAALQPFGIPGSVFVFSAALIWPWPIAFALSMTGSMAASVVGFSFARFVARDWVATVIPARFKRFEGALERRAFVTVFTLRFLFWMPQLLHVFFGVSKVPFWTHFWGSLAGYCIPLLAVSFFGEKFLEAVSSWPLQVWVVLGVCVSVLALTIVVVRRRRATR